MIPRGCQDKEPDPNADLHCEVDALRLCSLGQGSLTTHKNMSPPLSSFMSASIVLFLRRLLFGCYLCCAL